MTRIENIENDDLPDAQRFWLDFTRGSGLAYYVIARLAEHAGQVQGGALDGKMNALLQGLDYATTIEEVMAAFVPASQSLHAFWSGRYALFDTSGGGDYHLDISEDSIALHAGDTVVEGDPAGCFLDGRIVLGDDTYALELALELPARTAAAAAVSGQPRCRGTLRITEHDATRTVQLIGKRGCLTFAGVQREEDGDPPEIWAGTYQLMSHDTFALSDELLRLTVRDGALHVKLKTRRATEVRYINNRVVCDLGDRGKLAAELERLPGGQVQLRGAFVRGTTQTAVTGFRIDASPDATKGGV